MLFQRTGAANAYEVRGLILGKYRDMGYEGGVLGFPKSNELDSTAGGKYNLFDNGNLYWSAATGAWPVLSGPIMDAWAQENYENGRLGFPISEQRSEGAALVQDFKGGTIRVG